jgi:hypothetical protein
MRLINEFIERRLIGRQGANALLGAAADDTLANCPNADHSNFEEAIRIIRKELMPRLGGAGAGALSAPQIL